MRGSFELPGIYVALTLNSRAPTLNSRAGALNWRERDSNSRAVASNWRLAALKRLLQRDVADITRDRVKQIESSRTPRVLQLVLALLSVLPLPVLLLVPLLAVCCL